MAQVTELAVAPRTVIGKATRHLRKSGVIPANIYGHKEDSMAVQIDARTFDRLRSAHGLRNIISLRIAGKPGIQTVLVRHIQHDAVTGNVLHVDLSRVSMEEQIEMKIPLHFVGEAPGVKIMGGVLLHLLDALPVKCKASDILESIEVDLSSLADIDATLYARDVKLPAGYELAIDSEEPITKVVAPRAGLPEEMAATVSETTTSSSTPVA